LYVENAAIGNLCGKREGGISGNEEVVARIVLQFQGVAGAFH
jgi:hypothetical protein